MTSAAGASPGAAVCSPAVHACGAPRLAPCSSPVGSFCAPGEGRGRRLGVLSVQNVHLLHLRSGRESEYRLSSEGSKDGMFK